MADRLSCPACRRYFRGAQGVADHVRDKHPRWTYDPASQKGRVRPEPEESMGDIFVQAEIDRAMGEPIEDWTREMLP